MYVSSCMDYQRSKLLVSERINGERILVEYPLVLEYYVPDKNGTYLGYDGVSLKKKTFNTYREYKAEKIRCKETGEKTYELFFNLENKVLYKQYQNSGVPELHKSFMDIEVDRKGFEYLTVKELVNKACCPINAISIYNEWEDKLYTLMLCPDSLKFSEAQDICNKFENTILFKDEKDLLKGIILLFDDSDTISGFNSQYFDIPYIVRRIINVLGKNEVKKLCLFDKEPEYKEDKNDFGDINITYNIPGKWSADYLLLYKKHEQGKKESYKLDAIAELELGERKVQHDESLDDMYRQRYEDFIKYNRQDTMLVKRFEDKFKYIDIHNEQAHDIRCNLDDTMGTVAWVDQAIINEAHNNGIYVPDRVDGKNSEFNGIIPPGAFVPKPKTGLHRNIISFDMASLYPSCIRSINISPEMIVGQVKLTLTLPYLQNKIKENNLYKKKSTLEPHWGNAWANEWGTLEYNEILNKTNTILTIKMETGEEFDLTAKDIYNMIWAENSNLCISAFGTIFRTDKKGLMNIVLSKWFSERKEFKKKKGYYEDMALGVSIDDELKDLLMEEQ